MGYAKFSVTQELASGSTAMLLNFWIRKTRDILLDTGLFTVLSTDDAEPNTEFIYYTLKHKDSEHGIKISHRRNSSSDWRIVFSIVSVDGITVIQSRNGTSSTMHNTGKTTMFEIYTSPSGGIILAVDDFLAFAFFPMTRFGESDISAKDCLVFIDSLTQVLKGGYRNQDDFTLGEIPHLTAGYPLVPGLGKTDLVVSPVLVMTGDGNLFTEYTVDDIVHWSNSLSISVGSVNRNLIYVDGVLHVWLCYNLLMKLE